MTERTAKPTPWTRRALLLAGAGGGVALFAGRTTYFALGQTVPARTVSVADFGARGTGQVNETGAFQRACDALGGGGVVAVPAGTYLVDRVVIRNRGVAVRLAA